MRRVPPWSKASASVVAGARAVREICVSVSSGVVGLLAVRPRGWALGLLDGRVASLEHVVFPGILDVGLVRRDGVRQLQCLFGYVA